MTNLSVHSELGCVLFLNADIDNKLEAGKITRASNGFVKTVGASTKEEIIGQNILKFVLDDIAQVH